MSDGIDGPRQSGDTTMSAAGSAYGKGAPSYESAEMQKHAIEGRLKVARGIAERAARAGNTKQAARWRVIVDELLDRLNEVRGR